jgi:hypothetical protein
VQGRKWVALTVSLVWIAGNLATFGLRSDFAVLPGSYIAVQVVAPYLLALVALLGALHPGRLGLGADLRMVVGLTLAGPATFAALAAVGPLLYPDGFQNSSLGGCVGCLETTIFWAATPLVLGALTLRRAFVSGAGWRAALVGASCGLLAGGTINLHCPNADTVHVIVGHGIPMLVTTLVGAIAMTRWARA